VRPARYEWIPGLGNAQIRRTSRRLVRITSPSTAVELLTLAREAARERRRVIFFCSCGLPRWCHRSVVATLLLRAASAYGIRLRIEEWPGGEPRTRPIHVELASSQSALRALLPLTGTRGPARLAALPYGTLVQVDDQFDDLVPVGPARYGSKKWYLPMLLNYSDGTSVRGTPRAVSDWRRRYGYGARDA